MKRTLCCGLLLSSLLALGSARAADWDEISWHENAAGYTAALKLAERNSQMVLVYFYTTWCPYCRELNQNLLSDPAVQAQIGTMLAVRVNAEAGADEQSLANHYGVRGYPALFVYTPAQGGSFAPIRRTVRDGDATRLKTGAEFVATLKGAGARAGL